MGKKVPPAAERVKVVSVRIRASVWRQVRQEALDEETTVQKIVNDAIEAYLGPPKKGA